MGKVSRSSEVQKEILQLAQYIARDNVKASIYFIKLCKETFENLAKHKFLGSKANFQKTKLNAVRVFPVKNYHSYLIFYVPTKEGVRILHVLHGARNLLDLM